MLKISKWSTQRRIESLRQMDLMLRDMGSSGRDTIWRDYGGALGKSEEDTYNRRKRIAEDDEAYLNAIFCYMVCTLEPITFGHLEKCLKGK